METTYISMGYKNKKEVTNKFPVCESSKCHGYAALKMVILPATTCA